MYADIKGALNQLNKSYRVFEHKGKSMTKSEVKKVLEYGLKRGYKSTSEFTEDEIDKILNKHQDESLTINDNEKSKKKCCIYCKDEINLTSEFLVCDKCMGKSAF